METLATPGGARSILRVRGARSREDGGEFECAMSNPYGADVATVRLVVQGDS